MDNLSTQTIPIQYPEWMQRTYDDVFIGARWNYASIEDVVRSGAIHLFDTVNMWCGAEISDVVWTDNSEHATCPLCLRRKLRYLRDFHTEEILQPINQLIFEIEGEYRQFASESELAELMRIAKRHPSEWRKLGSRF